MITKEQLLAKILSSEKPICKYCQTEMNLWEVPEIAMGDGLGWGTPYLYVCFNDDCKLYADGWNNIRENYAHNASYRCICYPETDVYECIPVFSPEGGKGQILDDEILLQKEAQKEAIKRGFSMLADFYRTKDYVSVLKMLLDPLEPERVKLKAAEMIGDIGELDVIDSLNNYRFGNEIVQNTVNDATQKIHDRFFTRECPFCAEIIKKRAKICKHCGKDIAGV